MVHLRKHRGNVGENSFFLNKAIPKRVYLKGFLYPVKQKENYFVSLCATSLKQENTDKQRSLCTVEIDPPYSGGG